jgi:hypothetical protein
MPREVVYSDRIFEVWVDYESKSLGWKKFDEPIEALIKKSERARNFYEFHYTGKEKSQSMKHYDDLSEEFLAVTELNKRVLEIGGNATADLESANQAFTKMGECLYRIHNG